MQSELRRPKPTRKNVDQSVDKVSHNECVVKVLLHVARMIIPNHNWEQKEFHHIRQCDGFQQQNQCFRFWLRARLLRCVRRIHLPGKQ